MAIFNLLKKLVCTVMIIRNLEALSMILRHDFTQAFTYMAAPSPTTCQKCSSRQSSVWAQVIFKKFLLQLVSRISCLSSQFGSEFSLEHIYLKCFLNPIQMMVKKFKQEYIHKHRDKGRKSLEKQISWGTSEIWKVYDILLTDKLNRNRISRQYTKGTVLTGPAEGLKAHRKKLRKVGIKNEPEWWYPFTPTCICVLYAPRMN